MTGPDRMGFYGAPVTCQICDGSQTRLAECEVLCERHMAESKDACLHNSIYREGPDPAVGLFGWVAMCEDCGLDLTNTDQAEPDYDGDYADRWEDEPYED